MGVRFFVLIAQICFFQSFPLDKPLQTAYDVNEHLFDMINGKGGTRAAAPQTEEAAAQGNEQTPGTMRKPSPKVERVDRPQGETGEV